MTHSLGLSLLRLTLLLLMLVHFPGWLLGATTLNFPRLSFVPDTFTGLAIVNPNPQDAVITLTAYGANGQPLPGINNPAQLTVPANQQLAQLAQEILGTTVDPSTVAWIQVTSPSDNLTGFFLFLNGNQTLFDGADLPRSANNIVFNQVRLEDGFSTELNVLNPGGSEATIQLELISGGSVVAQQTLILPARGAARLDAATFFGVASADPAAYVTADTNVPIAGFEFVTSPNGDLLGLNAQRLTQQLTSLFFPQVSVRGAFKTELGLINYTNFPIIVTVTANRPDGSRFGPEQIETNPVTLTLNPRESRLEDVDLLFGFKGSEIVDGWLEIASTAAALNGYISYGIPATGATAAVVSPAVGSTRSIFSHIATDLGFFTGVAVLNPGQLATNLRILGIESNGNVLGSFTTVLQPGQRISQLITELVPESDGQSGGLIWVKSDLPVLSTSLFGSNTVLANIPPQPAPDSYLPDADIPVVQVNPPIAIVQPQSSQQFQLVGTNEAGSWSVNGVPGGNNVVGSIDASGRYIAPAVIPDPRVVTVTGGTATQLAGASVDILDKQVLLASTSIVQSVAFLGSLERLYVAELALLGAFSSGSGEAPPALPSQVGTNSELFEVAPGNVRLLLTQFPNETVTKILPYQAANGQGFLIATLLEAGKLVRIDPATRQSTDIFLGLNRPSTAAFDLGTGNLLVATENAIVVVPRSFLDLGLTSSAAVPDPGGEVLATTLTNDTATDVVTDACTGDVYFTNESAGTLRRLVRATGILELVANNLNRPDALLALHRRGVGCPESLQLLVAERGANRVLTILPTAISGVVQPWLPADEATDLAFLPGGTEYADTSGVLVAELLGSGTSTAQLGNGITSIVPTPGIYGNPILDPDEDEETCSDFLLNNDILNQAILLQLGLGPDELIPCEQVNQLTNLTVQGAAIQDIGGLEQFPELTILNLRGNRISDLTPLAELTDLVSLDLSGNDIADLFPLRNLLRLTILNLADNQISDLRPLGRLTALVELNLSANNISDIGPLANLTSLRRLFLANNQISDLSPLDRSGAVPVGGSAVQASLNTVPAGGGLIELDATANRIRSVDALASHTDLVRLLLSGNLIESIAALANLIHLDVLELSNNLVRDLRALVDNPGITEGDSIKADNNPFFLEASCANIAALRAKGVTVNANLLCVGLGAGPDLIIGRVQGRRGTSIEVPIRLRQNPDNAVLGGPDEIAATVFCVDYDQNKLFVDPSDLNMDNIPDSVRFTLPAGFVAVAVVDNLQPQREICIAVAGLNRLFLTTGFVHITYQINGAAPLGICPLRFSNAVPVSTGDRRAVSIRVDEKVNGLIEITN